MFHLDLIKILNDWIYVKIRHGFMLRLSSVYFLHYRTMHADWCKLECTSAKCLHLNKNSLFDKSYCSFSCTKEKKQQTLAIWKRTWWNVAKQSRVNRRLNKEQDGIQWKPNTSCYGLGTKCIEGLAPSWWTQSLRGNWITRPQTSSVD
jgi:hypothetical protein